MTLSLLAHATGIAALGLSVNGMVNRCDHTLRRTTSVASLLWTLNNLLLGATSAAAMSALSATRTTAADLVHQRGEHARHWACATFILVALAASALTWQGWPTLLTASASVAVSFGVFYLAGAQLRFVMLVSALLWSYNAWLIHSPEQIMGNSLGIAAAGYGVWRTRKSAAPETAMAQVVERQIAPAVRAAPFS
jgi:inner membrane protein